MSTQHAIHETITALVRDVLEQELPGALAKLLAPPPPRKALGRPRTIPVATMATPEPEIEATQPKRRGGRRRKLTPEQRKANSAAYQREYRKRKIAEAQART